MTKLFPNLYTKTPPNPIAGGGVEASDAGRGYASSSSAGTALSSDTSSSAASHETQMRSS